MLDFTLKYDVLEAIAKRSDAIGKQAIEYANCLASQVNNAISNVVGQPSAYLDDASFFINQKIKQLDKKSQEFYNFADQIIVLSETANRVDEEVKNLFLENQKNFLKHHESLRINGWKANFMNLLIDSKNKVTFTELIGKMLSVMNISEESMKSSLKYFYNREGDKSVNKTAGTGVTAASAVATLVLISTSRKRKMVSKAIGEGIAESNTYTSREATIIAANDKDSIKTDLKNNNIILKNENTNTKTNENSKTVSKTEDKVAEETDIDRIICNLKKCDGFGYKKDAMIKAAEALLREGYEPAFVAGLLANIKHEGSPGVFESSNYKGSFKLLSNNKDNGRYLDYEDSKNYNKKGAYLIYMDKYTSYSKEFSGKTITDVGLVKVNDLLKQMKKTGEKTVIAGKWKDGKFIGYYDKKTSGGFGLGMIQWTYGRAQGLIDYYNTKKFDKDGCPTQEECLETEIEYMIKELKSKAYKGIYGDGKKYDCSNKDAAYDAAYDLCMKYEIPSDTKNKAKQRGEYAKEVYKVMMGDK